MEKILLILVILFWVGLFFYFGLPLLKNKITPVYAGRTYRKRINKDDCPYKNNSYTVSVRSVTNDGWVNYSLGEYFDNQWAKKEIFNAIYELGNGQNTTF